MIDFSVFRSILCLNGTLPRKSFFNRHSLPIIAADGAANNLIEIGVNPSLVIGDLDSLDSSLKDSLTVLYHYDQNLCDFEKCLFYLEEHKLLPSIVVGMNGGYIDHILNNINLFLNTNNIFYAPPIIGFTMNEQEEKRIILPNDTKLSILGIPEAEVSSEGLRWDLRNFKLAFPGKTSCFNRSAQPEVYLNVHKGTILILIYRDFE